MKRYFPALLVPLMLLSGCSFLKTRICSEKAGYNKGAEDARLGRVMRLNEYSVLCDAGSAALAEKGYREGYASATPESGGQINVTFDKGRMEFAGAYECRLNYRGEAFREKSATAAKARAGVMEKCRARYGSCPETAVDCVKN